MPVNNPSSDVLIGWFNVKDYGAVGDGSADDTTAVQDTIDAADAAGSGVVWFPPGTYLCSALTVSENVSLIGAGIHGAIIKASSSGALLTISPVATNNMGGVISDLTLNGNSTGTYGISATSTYHIRLERMFITSFTSAGVYLRGGLISSFYACDIESCPIGIDIADSADARANLIQLLETRLMLNTTWGLKLVNGGMLRMDNCDVEVNGTNGNSATGAIYISAGIEDPIGAIITGCWLEQNHGGAIIKFDTPDIAGTHNIVDSCQIVTNNTTYGFYVEGASASNILTCRNVERHSSDTTGTVYYANGGNATIYLEYCVGNTGGAGTITTELPLSASGLLTLIETVDGSGSLLDADTLDGHDSTYFASAVSDTNTIDLTLSGGTLSAAFVPTANVSMASNKLTNVTDPSSAQDAATKGYVDAQISALPGGAGQVTGIARWAASSSQTNFDLPDIAEFLVQVTDNGSMVDPLTYSLSPDGTQLVFDSGITAAHVVTAEFIVAQV